MISENCIVEVKSIYTHSVVGYECALEEEDSQLTCFYNRLSILP
jgi:hypothetical protein